MKNARLVLALMLVLALSCKRGEQAAADTHAYDNSRGKAAAKASAPAATTTGIEVGSMMPEYSAMWLDGSKFDLQEHRKNVVLLNLWATWCGPCRFEIPELQLLHEKYAPRNFEVIGVSLDESGVDAVKQFVAEQKKMTYPIALDADGDIANLLQTTMLPTTVLVDRSGRIVWKRYGLIEKDDAELTKAIEAAL
ncbi:MAG TPA: TlpA disulfide reductase family protein [Thermoanaerobaculia bacterium]|jgi:thiol-disulfide isomerase/thioredoxin